MRVLISGHRGYVGTNAVEIFSAAGHHVTGLDIGLYEGCEFGPSCEADEDLPQDLFDLTPDRAQGIDAIVHLAAISNDPLGELDPVLTERINTAGTFHVARCAKTAGVPRFLFASSCAIYGAAGVGALTEDAPMVPLSVYAKSKVDAENELRKLASASFGVTALRCATAFGESPALRTDLVVNNLVAHAVTTAQVKLLSSGLARRPLLHCRDMARAFLAFAEAPHPGGFEAVNIGSAEQNYRILDLAQQVRDQVPGAAITFADGAVDDPRDYEVAFSRLRERLPDFRCLHDVPTTVRVLSAQYRRRRNFAKDFEAGRFSRVATLQRRFASGDLPEPFSRGYVVESASHGRLEQDA